MVEVDHHTHSGDLTMTRFTTSRRRLLKSLALGVALVAGGLGVAQGADNYVQAYTAVCTDPSHHGTGWWGKHPHLLARNARAEAEAHARATGHTQVDFIQGWALRRDCVP
jgi:hypothetical protein